MRREGTSSLTVPSSPLPLDTHSEEERRDTKVKFILGKSCVKLLSYTSEWRESGRVGCWKGNGKVDRK